MNESEEKEVVGRTDEPDISGKKSVTPFISSIDLVADPNTEPIEWLVDGLIPRQTVTIIAGEPGCYKTWFAICLARSVSEGESFLGRRTSKCRVYYIDKENPKSLIISRLDLTGRAQDFEFWGLWSTPEPPLLGDSAYQKIAKERPLVIFDTLLKFHTGDENSSRDMGRVSKMILKLRDAGATVLVLHHKGKSQFNNYRGSSEILGSVDVAYSLSKGSGGDKILTLNGFKNRFVPEPKLTLEVVSTDEGFFFEDISEKKERVKEFEDKERLVGLKETIERLTVDLQRYPNQSEIQARLKETDLPFHKARTLLSKGEEEYWKIIEGDKGAKLYAPIDSDGELFRFSAFQDIYKCKAEKVDMEQDDLTKGTI